MLKYKAKNLFVTKTFQGALLGFLAGLAPLVIPCFYQHRGMTEQEAIALAGLLIVFGWALVGRAQTSPVYTENWMPGANKSDFK